MKGSFPERQREKTNNTKQTEENDSGEHLSPKHAALDLQMV